MRSRLATAALFSLWVSTSLAAGLLSEDQARAKAFAILKGDPYGSSVKEVSEKLKEVQLIVAGSEKCSNGKVRVPVWQFHVVVPKEKMTHGNSPIDGHMLLDARTGKMVCAGLPFLD